MTRALHFLNRLFASPGWVLLLVVVFSLAYFIFAHEGFYWIDDYGYAKYAWQVAEGTFSVTPTIHASNPLTHRLMTFAPVALFYKFFGINIYTTTLWPLLCTLGCSGLIYFLYRKENPKVAVFGMILLGLYFHTLFLATYLFSDNILMFFAFAAVAVLYRFRYQTAGQKQLLYVAWFVLFNFLAFLTKETIIYYLPFYLFLFLQDLFQKKRLAFWLWSAGLGILVLAFYFGYYHFRTGDFLYRFHVIEQTNTAYHGDAPAPTDAAKLFSRLTSAPLFFFIGSGIMLPLIFALGLLPGLKFRKFSPILEPAYFWFLLTFLVLIQFWFGSTSLQFYNPISLLPRMITHLLPPLCLAGAFGLQQFLTGNRSVCALFAFLFLVSTFLDRSNTVLMYAPLAVFFTFLWWKMRKPGKQQNAYLFTVLMLAAVLGLRPLYFMYKPSLMSFQEENKIVKEYLNQESGRNLVIGDRWQNFMYDFHYGFERNPHYEYRQYKEAGTDFSQYDKVYLLVNRSNLSNPDMAKWQTIQEPEINRLYPEKKLIAHKGKVLLYQVK
ncbi:ArnT family glycosyltransferase [Adhaeribacter soli]|uniref:Uncharacterized protein n=1 Tax=Adhaeribacter soli TaxID=2607655 RepID=A0A5N1J7V5_9BACT|nr:glycosyltransferase family 39 protein [Adhaeribacter soli]KAA9340751.1 hypothetical protein F0P94_04805 [Adhaeribacter soli]